MALCRGRREGCGLVRDSGQAKRGGGENADNNYFYVLAR